MSISRIAFFFLVPLLLLSAAECRAQSATERMEQALGQLQVQAYDSCQAQLLPSGREKFEDMFEAIRQARRYVHLEYFNFRNDSIGNALFSLLAQKVSEGVEVRALFDSFGNMSNNRPLTEEHLERLRDQGIEIYEFDPFRFPWINHAYHRDHRKIVVIDGEIAYSGGMNVADYYINGKPEIGEWRDMHMRMEGSVVAGYQQLFAEMWQKQTGEVLDSATYAAVAKAAGDKRIWLVDRAPRRKRAYMRHTYASALDAAQHHVQLVNPYPTNVRAVRRALRRALRRGVRVEFMVSSTCDEPITPDVVGIEMKKLMKQGCEVYYYEGGFHHSKLLMVDGEFCTVGSTNLDARSLCFDYEVNAVVMNRETTQELQQIFEKDKEQSTLLTQENFRQRFSLGHRILGRIFGIAKGFF